MLLTLAGCDDSGRDGSQSSGPSTTLRPDAAARPSPPTTTLPTVPPTTLDPPIDDAEGARRLLERHGIDPGQLSSEIGEHMRKRFQPRATE